MNHPYLKNKTVQIVPVEAGSKWKKLLVNPKDKSDSPFLFDKIQKILSVPLKSYDQGGGLVEILDSLETKECPDFSDEKLTEREYFEKVFNADLNPYSRTSDFWTVDKRGKLFLEAETKTLNLANPLHMLQYKVALANTRYVAKDLETYKLYKMPSVEFVIIDQDKQTTERVEKQKRNNKRQAAFNKNFENIEAMRDILGVAGISIAPNVTMDQMQANYTDFFHSNPKLFEQTINDSFFEHKTVIYKAVERGLLTKVRGVYSTDSGEQLGDLSQAISWLKNPENESAVVRIKGQLKRETTTE